MHFKEVFSIWNKNRLNLEEAARMLSVTDPSFRRYIDRYNENGLEGLNNQRQTQTSARKAPVDEVLALVDRYKSRHNGWNTSHFHMWYQREGGTRSYTWVKNQFQSAHAIPKRKKRGVHRKKRERSSLPGMMIHQDARTHEWVPGKKWDLVVTMDDAINEHYSMFFFHADSSIHSTTIVAVTTGTLLKPVARSARRIRLHSDGRGISLASR